MLSDATIPGGGVPISPALAERDKWCRHSRGHSVISSLFTDIVLYCQLKTVNQMLPWFLTSFLLLLAGASIGISCIFKLGVFGRVSCTVIWAIELLSQAEGCKMRIWLDMWCGILTLTGITFPAVSGDCWYIDTFSAISLIKCINFSSSNGASSEQASKQCIGYRKNYDG